MENVINRKLTNDEVEYIFSPPTTVSINISLISNHNINVDDSDTYSYNSDYSEEYIPNVYCGEPGYEK